MENNNKTKLTTGKVRFSYLNAFEPKSVNGGDEKYSVSLIISKLDTKTIAEVNNAVEEAIKLGVSKFGAKFTAGGNFKKPLRDGATDRVEDPAYSGCYFVNANSKEKPQVVDKNVKPILDRSEIYSGCFGRASITFYPFNTNGNKGIACSLGNIQKLSEGEPLSGRSRAEDDFTTADEDDFLA